jgi:hypothetical protein
LNIDTIRHDRRFKVERIKIKTNDQENMKKTVLLLLSLICIFCLNSCTPEDSIFDITRIKDFHKFYNSIEKHQLHTDVDLFVDYSTCLSRSETSKSNFFSAIHPKIIACNPSFWSIKGESIVKEDGDVYTLLNNIKEVNYANLRGAVEMIVRGKNQAILITDGEYFQKNGNASNFNNPYLSESFKKWLMAGHDIYIYAERYRERNVFEKFRYYFLFTDREIEDNIYQKLSRDVPLNGDLKLTKLSSTDFRVFTKYDGVSKPKVNNVLSLNPESYISAPDFEFQEYQLDWKDIVEYIQYAYDPITGELMPGGDFVLRGIFVDSKSLDYFTIQDIGVKVYNAYDAFRTFEDTSYVPRTRELKEIEELFSIDEKAFRKNGEVILKIHKNFDGTGLNNKHMDIRKENLLKVDIIIKKAKDNFVEKINDFSVFKFTSVDNQLNESIYQSIKNTIEDASINPQKVNKGILYTIYIKTATSNL